MTIDLKKPLLPQLSEIRRGVCVVCGGPAPRESRCTNGRCNRCHVTHCTPGGATSPGHNPIGVDVDGQPLAKLRYPRRGGPS